MISRKVFAKLIVDKTTTQLERAVAFIWFYHQTVEFDDRTASELARELSEEGFSKPNTTRLNKELAKTRDTVRGKRPKSYKISLTSLEGLDAKYQDFIDHIEVPVTDSILPAEWFVETRGYLQNLVRQINGGYDVEFYDSCAVMMRRLMEVLLIEVFDKNKKTDDIKENGNFVGLEKIIKKALLEKFLHWNRNSKKDMEAVKLLGDLAAHDRRYEVHESDITELKTRYRRLINELFEFAGLRE